MPRLANCSITFPKLPRFKHFTYITHKRVTKFKIRKGVIRKLDFSPSDWLVITFPERMDREQVVRAGQILRESLRHDRVLVIDSNPSIEVLHHVP